MLRGGDEVIVFSLLMLAIDMTEAILRDDSKKARDNGCMLQQKKFWLDVKENTVHSVAGWALQ